MTQLTLVDAWRANGVSLNTLKFSIDQVSGLDSLPPKRSRTQQVAHRHGGVEFYGDYFQPKTINLSIFIAPNDENGVVSHADGQRGHIRENLDELLGIFGSRAAILLQRDVYVSGGTVTRFAQARVTRQIPISGSRGTRRLIVTLELLWPFWESAVQTENRSGAGPLLLNIGGNTPCNHFIVTFANGTDQRLAVAGLSDYVEIVGATPAGGVRVNTRERTVTRLSNGNPYDANLLIGASRWLQLDDGGFGQLDLTGTVPGDVTVDWFDAWL